MPTNSNLNNIFVWVPRDKVAAFRNGEGQPNNTPVGEQAAYLGKIAFLEGTQEIMTNGKVFGLNNTEDITNLQNVIGAANSATFATLKAQGIQATDVIGFLNELKGLIDANATAIGTATSGLTAGTGLTKRVEDLEATIDTATTGLSDRMDAAEDAIDLLNGDANTSGSVAHSVATAVAAIVDNADTDFDTLREIAAWIQGEAGNATAFDAVTRIQTLETKVGNARGTDELYTAEEAAAYNTEHGLSSGDPGYKNEGDVKTPGSAPTGLYNSIADLQAQINVITGNSGSGGSISDLITAAVNDLDSSVTLQGTTLTQPQNVTKDSTIDVLGSVTVAEVDGELDQTTSSYIVLQADAAGAAADAYSALLGTANDASDGTAYTIHGVWNYAKAIVDGKNVTATGESGTGALVEASASGNAITVQGSQKLHTAIQLAETALQSVTIASTDSDLLSVAATPNTPGGVTLDVQTGTLSTGTTTNVVADTTNGKLATVDNIATAINGITLWETYTDQQQNP